MKNFVHLHLHTEASMLDSSLKVSSLVSRACELEMPAVAVTDHGNMLAGVTFFKEAKKKGIKPILGCELYVAAGENRFYKPKRGLKEINYHHLLALVKNEQGYKNLSNLITLSFTEGFYRKPRVDKELLKKYKDGLIIMSACIQGEVPYYLIRDNYERSLQAAKWYQEVFGDDYYLEAQNHGLQQQIDALPGLMQISKELSIPLVATNDVHYLNKEDSEAREILVCLNTRCKMSDPNRPMKKENDEMYLKDYSDMAKALPQCPDALNMTLDVAKKCNFEFGLGKYYYPNFKTPEKYTLDEYFKKICNEGFEELKVSLKAQGKDLSLYEERLNYELSHIIKMGFPGYFLIVWDIIRFCNEVGILVGPGRGSVVGSLVSYSMGITTVDPLEYDLIFERFLNPERISMPDIDLDFDPERREEVISYIRDTYGKESVCQIVTLGRMKAKNVIRDIARVLDIPLNFVSLLTKALPKTPPDINLEYELENNIQFQEIIQNTPKGDELIKLALKLENNVRQTGTHAAGVVIAPKKLTEFMPLYKSKEDIVSQYEKDEVEEIGLLKLDILGLKTLTIVKKILEQIELRHNKKLLLEDIPLNDAKTFEIYQKGDTDGIFQFESSGMRSFLVDSQPNVIGDLIALNALYRPGPLDSNMATEFVQRKKGLKEIVYPFPELEPILKDTYGVIVYQEQVMRIAVAIGGFSMGKADGMRKIMGKKLMDKIEAVGQEFVESAVKRGFDREKTKELFKQIETFARYGFNKSHATAYAILSYQTAYLKAHYPVFFMAAHLSNESDKSSTDAKVVEYIIECKKMGIEILPPDINKSYETFMAESENSIRYGLKGLKNCGGAVIENILKQRDEGGEFKNFSDFMTRIDLSKVNKAVVESLIKAGVLDSFSMKRSVMYNSLSAVLEQATAIQKFKGARQNSLFEDTSFLDNIIIPDEYASLEEWSMDELIKGEKEIAGFYIKNHPLAEYEEQLKFLCDSTTSSLRSAERSQVRLFGVFTGIKEIISKKGNKYGELSFEDYGGSLTILSFNNNWQIFKDKIDCDKPYVVDIELSREKEDMVSAFLISVLSLEDLMKLKNKEKELARLSNGNLLNAMDKKFKKFRVAAILNAQTIKTSAKNKDYAELIISDLSTSIKVMAFNKALESIKNKLISGEEYFITIEKGDDNKKNWGPSYFVHSIELLKNTLKKRVSKLFLKIQQEQINKAFNSKLKNTLKKYQSSVPYQLAIYHQDGDIILMEPEDGSGLTGSYEMKKEMESILGEGTVEMVFER